MNDLIKIEKMSINGAEVNSVNARDLHRILEVKKAYTTWISSSLVSAGAIEGEDFLKLKSSLEGSGYQLDYILTTDMSKHIAMMSKVPKAKEVRDYFINIEKQYKQPILPQTYLEALQALTVSVQENIKLTQTVKLKDEVILAVADLNIKAGDVSIGDFSKNLAIEGLGQNNLFKWLKGRGFLALTNAPYQPYVERGYFVRKPSKEKINGEYKYTTYLTPKGTVWLTRMLKAEYELEDARYER